MVSSNHSSLFTSWRLRIILFGIVFLPPCDVPPGARASRT
jgi:hypothetical protein